MFTFNLDLCPRRQRRYALISMPYGPRVKPGVTREMRHDGLFAPLIRSLTLGTA